MSLTDRKPSFVGTAFYLSPELLEGSPTGPWSDIWALAVFFINSFSDKLPSMVIPTFWCLKKLNKWTLH